jgi:LysM repeat protein
VAGGELFGHDHSVRAFGCRVKHPFVKHLFDFGLTIEHRFAILYEQSFVAQTFEVSRRRSDTGARTKGPVMAATMTASTTTWANRPMVGRSADADRSRYTVAVPHRLSRPSHSTYVRRRLVVLSCLFAFTASLALATHQGLAARGNDPVTVSTGGRATSYVVQPGDTLWAIAQRMHPAGVAEYVDALVSENGGSRVAVGELLRLP